MMKTLLKIGIICLALVGIYTTYNYFTEPVLPIGATVTTINASDYISASRTTINTNFSNLNTSKLEISDWFATTTAPHLTTLSNLTTVGTIGTGVWNGTAIGVAYGGTGTTSPLSNYVMLGNGASGLKAVSSLGTSGQFLTSNGAGSAPTWQTSAVDQGIPYIWTAHHIFSSLFATNASSTNATSTNIYNSGTFTNGGTASTTDMIVSNDLTIGGSCTNCVPMYYGTASTPSGFADDSDVITVGFQPRYIKYEIEASDANESSWAWGQWMDPDGDGTGSYSTIQAEASFGSAQRQTNSAHDDSFTDGKMLITFGSFTSTGFTITYDKEGAAQVSAASISFTAIK